MVDLIAFNALTSGLYFISAKLGDRKVGCLVNTVMQVTAEPLQISVTVNKDNATAEAIRESKRFTASALSESATMELIGTFGFRSSRDIDKFAEVEHGIDEAGHPYVTQDVVAWFSVRVDQEFDVGTHVIFVGEVEEAEVVSSETPMSYSYYHQVKKGKTPPKASSYLGADAPDASGAKVVTPPAASAEAARGEVKAAYDESSDAAEGKKRYAWRCTICGYIEYMDELPDDYTCPVCHLGKEVFERIEVEEYGSN